MRSCFGIKHLHFGVVYNRLDKLTSTWVAWCSYSWSHSSTWDASEPAHVYSLVCHGCFQVIHDRICFVLIIVCLKGGVEAGLVATAYALVAAYQLHILKCKAFKAAPYQLGFLLGMQGTGCMQGLAACSCICCMTDAVGVLVYTACCGADRPHSKLTVSLQVPHTFQAFLA